MDRGFAIRMPGPGRHRRTDSRDLSADVASAIDRVLGRAPARPARSPIAEALDTPEVSTQEQEKVPPDGAA
jgi:hypothetical protein